MVKEKIHKQLVVIKHAGWRWFIADFHPREMLQNHPHYKSSWTDPKSELVWHGEILPWNLCLLSCKVMTTFEKVHGFPEKMQKV